jgi:hypothetical protein
MERFPPQLCTLESIDKELAHLAYFLNEIEEATLI